MRTLFLALLGLLVAAPASANDTATWLALLSGKAVALMRHTDAPGGYGDPPGFKLEDCATQRNLSAKGRADAAAMGLLLRNRWVRPTRIVSSPWCRCVDTARLMELGRQVEIDDTFGNAVVWSDRREALATGARDVIRAWKGPAALLVVTHGANIAALTGYNPSSGEIVVVDTALKEIGRIPVPAAR